MSNSACFVTQINPALASQLKADLKTQGFTLSEPIYTFFQAKKKGVSCTLYLSGKLTVQGKDKEAFITYYLEPQILKEFSYSYPDINLDLTPRIGMDESGKGDVFGPLCMCALYADSEGIRSLVQLGIKDSKKISDPVILQLATKIKKNYPCGLITIFPSKYNALYEQFKNLNTLLAWGHSAALEQVLKKVECQEVIIDQFAKEAVVERALEKKGIHVNLTQRHRGEEDVVVAAASIVARAAFVEGIDTLEKTYNHPLPKGASQKVLQAGRRFVTSQGKNTLQMVAKLHFKTVKEMIEPSI